MAGFHCNYLQGCSCPKKLQLQLSDQKHTVNTLNARQDSVTSIYQSYCEFSLLFSQKISTKHDITSTKISYQFLAPKVPISKRNKPTNSSTLTDPFSAATKTLVLGNVFKFERFTITFAWAFCH